MYESTFQSNLRKEIKKRFPGSVILKNDPQYFNNVPDLLVIYKNHWAMLECKKSKDDYLKGLINQPGQKWWIDKFAAMSFASYIYPENKEEVLHAMEQAFRS